MVPARTLPTGTGQPFARYPLIHVIKVQGCLATKAAHQQTKRTAQNCGHAQFRRNVSMPCIHIGTEDQSYGPCILTFIAFCIESTCQSKQRHCACPKQTLPLRRYACKGAQHRPGTLGYLQIQSLLGSCFRSLSHCMKLCTGNANTPQKSVNSMIITSYTSSTHLDFWWWALYRSLIMHCVGLIVHQVCTTPHIVAEWSKWTMCHCQACFVALGMIAHTVCCLCQQISSQSCPCCSFVLQHQ